MKTKLLIGGALLFSVAAFAQNTDAEKQKKNNHGANVSTVAKSEVEAETKGETVSTAASFKSRASINTGNNTSESRAQRKEERQAAREVRKQEQMDVVADIKAGAKARSDENSDISGDIKTESKAQKALLKETKEEAKAAREAVKAERNIADDDLLNANANLKIGKDNKKTAKANRPEKVKGGAKVGTDMQISRPKVGAKVRGTAGLGIL